eukprot:CAMPEP_0177655040 /NCGR_PEP_ID=MMETSP0447-20121125/14714_1 /TAXON_ID=0 /ORGANISM="Stygamoeba regulata, Strain BSH-02190019" /LENGTH=97 /DNA_ID=CAMNT_0019158851 /DNA_START=217 /DNA_END=510 /DNA_ORIENTATION=-
MSAGGGDGGGGGKGDYHESKRSEEDHELLKHQLQDTSVKGLASKTGKLTKIHPGKVSDLMESICLRFSLNDKKKCGSAVAQRVGAHGTVVDRLGPGS